MVRYVCYGQCIGDTTHLLTGHSILQEIIKRLVENSASFEQKTEFSRAKYLKRKQKKYDAGFRAAGAHVA